MVHESIDLLDRKLQAGDPLTDEELTSLAEFYAATEFVLSKLGPEFSLAYGEIRYRHRQVRAFIAAREED